MNFLAIGLNSEPVKYGLLILLAPYWVPFFRSLWRSLNDSLRDEGGLFGRTPTPDQLKDIEARLGQRVPHLTSTPKHFAGDQARARRARSKPRRDGPGTLGGTSFR